MLACVLALLHNSLLGLHCSRWLLVLLLFRLMLGSGIVKLASGSVLSSVSVCPIPRPRLGRGRALGKWGTEHQPSIGPRKMTR